MTTVTEAIEHFNKQTENKYHKIKVREPNNGKYSIMEFTDVSNVSKKDGILSFYGRAKPPIAYDSSVSIQNQIRFTRVNNGEIIYSEV